MWGIVATLVGIFLCFTIILAPVGIVLIILGAFPLYRLLNTTEEDILKKYHQEASEPGEPWEDTWIVPHEDS